MNDEIEYCATCDRMVHVLPIRYDGCIVWVCSSCRGEIEESNYEEYLRDNEQN